MKIIIIYLLRQLIDNSFITICYLKGLSCYNPTTSLTIFLLSNPTRTEYDERVDPPIRILSFRNNNGLHFVFMLSGKSLYIHFVSFPDHLRTLWFSLIRHIDMIFPNIYIRFTYSIKYPCL